jgi:gliding motility-associated-like protein
MLKVFLIPNVLIVLNLPVFSQSCPAYPEEPKTGILTYIRLPPSSAPSTIRFLYRMTIDCDSAIYYYDLAIADLRDPGIIIQDLSFQLDSSQNVTGVIDPCVILQTPPCRSTYYYHADAALPDNAFGYLASTINCCRPYALVNVQLSDQDNLNFYETIIGYCASPPACTPCLGPIYNGMISYIKVPPLSTVNNSARITSRDTILAICQNRPFSYQIQATDPDGDSIAYHFSNPRTFNVTEIQNEVVVQKTIGFVDVPFYSPYTIADPAGPGVSLDPGTGLLQGSIPDTGIFDLTISVMEYRNGILLDSVMLDQYVQVFDCAHLQKPIASIPPLLANCNSFTVTFPNNSTPMYQGYNFSNTTFQWEFGDGDTSGSTYPTHTYADTGAYQTSLIIFPGLWCADTAYSKVLVYPFVQASFTHNDSCLGQPVLFTSTSTSSGGAIASNHWDILQDSVSLDSSDNPTITYAFRKAPQTYTVLLTVETDKGCLNTDTQYVNIWPAPLPLSTHDTVLANGATLQLQANDGNNNHNGLFTWSPPEGLNNPDIANPLVNYNQAITYSVFIQNTYGCSLQDSIHIIYYTGPNIYLPNAFTPNGDGRNDIFRPLAVGIASFDYFRVFNRNGQIMFSTSKPGEGWDGTTGGRPAPAGTYVWEAGGIDANKKMMIRSGTVILIR